jgi:ADP-heptose:LPS heptosyltransferase
MKSMLRHIRWLLYPSIYRTTNAIQKVGIEALVFATNMAKRSNWLKRSIVALSNLSPAAYYRLTHAYVRHVPASSPSFESGGDISTRTKKSPVVWDGHDGSFKFYGKSTKIDSIIIFKVDHIGDFFLALDSLLAIRRAFINSSITLVCGKWNVALAKDLGLFDTVIEFPFFRSRADLVPTETRRQFANLPSSHYDLAIDLRVEQDTRILLDHINATYICGYKSDLCQRPLTISLSTPKEPNANDLAYHQRLMMLRLTNTIIHFFHTDADIPQILLNAFAGSTQGAIRKSPNTTIIAMNTSSGRAVKNWPVARFVEMASWLCKEMDCTVLLLGTKEALADADMIMHKSPTDKVISTVGKTTLREAVSLLAEADLYFGNDSGLAHVSARLGIPTVAIYSGIDPTSVWAPVGPDVTVIKSQVQCSPCHIQNISECAFERVCLFSIDVNFVKAVLFDKIQEIKKQKGSQANKR